MNNPHSTPGTPASTTKLLRRILLITAVVCATIFATLPHLTVLGTVRGVSLIPIAQAVLLWAALGLVVCALAALCARSFAAATILLIAAIAGVMPTLTPPPPQQADASCDAPVTVLSANLLQARVDPADVHRAITEADADLVVLLEVDEPFLTALADTPVGVSHPYRTGSVTDGGFAGSVILSRTPLVQEGVVPADTATVFDQPVARVTTAHGGEIRIAAIHPYPPTSQGEAWANTLAGVGTFQRTHTDLPLILAGDFNAGRGHAAFRSATSGLDAPAGLGSRIGQWTWPMGEKLGPFTTLDHILTRDFGVMSAGTLAIPGTDHAAVTATLTVCPAG